MGDCHLMLASLIHLCSRPQISKYVQTNYIVTLILILKTNNSLLPKTVNIRSGIVRSIEKLNSTPDRMLFTKKKVSLIKWSINTKVFKSSSVTIIRKESLPAAAYQPAVVEKHKYKKWEKNGLFQPESGSDKPMFSIVLPPPNVTGKLHLGHALACTIQDVIVRIKRSESFNVLWLPGMDHAGIATQRVVEKYLKTKHSINRHDISRKEFNNEVWKWKAKYGDTINQQLRMLGCSLDWSRETFTMNSKHTNAVNKAFIQLFKKGLIYRKMALVNWCNTLQSTVSDIEVENISIDGPTDFNIPGCDKPVKLGLLYDLMYKTTDNEELVVSTTMPETMLGDTAIAVHPDDPRYQHLRGKRVIHPFKQLSIPIIFDKFVDTAFGTGAVKVTPAHSKIDYEIAKQHNLPMVQVIDENRTIINGEQFDKLKRYECRLILVQCLKEMGILKEVKPHKMSLPICSRTGDIIEHLPKEQWFLSCSELNKVAAEAVKKGELNIIPEKFVKNWLDWTDNDRDWCISRQLWWGHQIPAYKCSANNDVIWVTGDNEESAKIEASKLLNTSPSMITVVRDTDVLDTWFSSGIYPFAALGWPENSDDFKKYYPLSLMATGHDILGFWVHRMVMLGLELTESLPFSTVLLHGIICDSNGAKMSKSRGNVIDPIDVINGISMKGLKEKSQDMHKDGILSKEELNKALAYHKSNFSRTDGIPECGVDALRFTVLSQDIKSHFVNFDVDQCHANKLFCNKIWQSIKYMQLQFPKLRPAADGITRQDLTYFDKWILSRLADMVKKVNSSIDTYDFHLATKSIRTLIYNEFCDVYLEATKPGFDKEDPKAGYAHAHTLSAVMNTSLRCLAPFMVYLPEELIPKIPAFEENIIHEFDDLSDKFFKIPKHKDFEIWANDNLEIQTENLLNAISLIRQMKTLYNMTNKVRPCIMIETSNEILKSDIHETKEIVSHLAKCSNVGFNKQYDFKSVYGVLDKDTKIHVELIGDNLDDVLLSAKNKLEKKVKKIEDTLLKLETKLSSDHYLNNVVERTRISDKESVSLKKEELKQLKRLIS